jgi:phage replication O-like protein O
MASPQKENGFTPIANELIEQLYKLPLNGTQFRIILVVFRYTYGFNRKEHELSETFIATALTTHKRQIQRELRSLIDMKVLNVVKQATFNSSRVVSFNKYYDRWLISRQVTNKTPDDKNVPHTGDGLDTSRGGQLVTQEIQIKDNIKEIEEGEEGRKKTEGEIFKFFNQNISPITPYQAETISKCLDDGMEPGLILEILKDGVGKREKWTWINKVLSNSFLAGIKTLLQYQTKKREQEEEKINKKQQQNKQQSKDEEFRQKQMASIERLRAQGVKFDDDQ